MPNAKTYLGDGAYVTFDGYSLILTTEDGIRATNTIVLEPEVYRALEVFVSILRTKDAEESAARQAPEAAAVGGFLGWATEQLQACPECGHPPPDHFDRCATGGTNQCDAITEDKHD